jgi:hypothetical protein
MNPDTQPIKCCVIGIVLARVSLFVIVTFEYMVKPMIAGAQPTRKGTKRGRHRCFARQNRRLPLA